MKFSAVRTITYSNGVWLVVEELRQMFMMPTGDRAVVALAHLLLRPRFPEVEVARRGELTLLDRPCLLDRDRLRRCLDVGARTLTPRSTSLAMASFPPFPGDIAYSHRKRIFRCLPPSRIKETHVCKAIGRSHSRIQREGIIIHKFLAGI